MATKIRINHCEKAELYTPDGQLLAQAAVRTTSSALQVILPQGIFEGKPQTCQVRFFDAQLGLVDCDCRLSQVFTSSSDQKEYWRCEIVHIVEVNDRRRDFKVKMDVRVKGSAQVVGTGGMQRNFSVKLLDLSAGGAQFSTYLLFSEGDKLTLFLPFGQDTEELSATVVRLVGDLEPEGGCRMYGYGCHFDNLTNEQEASLRKLVFAEQLKQRKQGKNSQFQIA